MKRNFAVLPFILGLLVLSACHHKAAISPLTAGSKRIAIVVSDKDGGGFVVEEPAPGKARVRINGHIHWLFINNCSTAVVESFRLHTFKDEGGSSQALFDGDQEYMYTVNLDPDEDNAKEKTDQVNKDAKGLTYTYKITAKVVLGGQTHEVLLDPRVIVSD